MKRYIVLFIVITLFSDCLTQKDKTTNARNPNIVLINVDDLGWKDLGFMGSEYYETPNLNAFARESMVFTNAYASASNCAPSRASMLSGLYTPRHGVYTVSPSDRGNAKTRRLIPVKNTDFLHDSIYTLPEMLKNAGYITGNFGKWHVGKNPATQGIDYNRGGNEKGNPGKNGYFSPYNVKYLEDGPKGEYLTDRLTQEALQFMEKYRDTSFFLYMPFYTVHTPIMGKPELTAKYKAKPGSKGQDNPEYAAMVTSMDENVGKILDFLNNNNLKENTIVIFTSDNGGIPYISSNAPLRAGKGSYYEGGIRVPLVIRWPGKTNAGSTSEERATNLDFYPTLQTFLNPGKKAPILDGKNLLPILEEDNIIERDFFFHFPIYLQNNGQMPDNGRDPLFRTRPGSVIISGDWKLHQYFEDEGLELYNLKKDVGETKNLVDKFPEKTSELLKKLEKWRKNTNAPVPTEKNPGYDKTFEQKQIRKLLKKE
ncbi:sulfatase [Gramella sp. AN32]|uniref:Sulfatase n=1 Tax=Christiangramia antarctica TaxID=2058158 RepID=A0ABW5X216_9FLAO|nr:sulfatase [Gramella sp. AN32]MCM4155798.1 aryl-sulfate sulfohydrolase [Gramella sp. AN32]